jgi:hypothetical protein
VGRMVGSDGPGVCVADGCCARTCGQAGGVECTDVVVAFPVAVDVAGMPEHPTRTAESARRRPAAILVRLNVPSFIDHLSRDEKFFR